MKKQFVEISDEEFLANVKPEDRERVKAERQRAREKIERLKITHYNYGSKGPPSGTIKKDTNSRNNRSIKILLSNLILKCKNIFSAITGR